MRTVFTSLVGLLVIVGMAAPVGSQTPAVSGAAPATPTATAKTKDSVGNKPASRAAPAKPKPSPRLAPDQISTAAVEVDARLDGPDSVSGGGFVVYYSATKGSRVTWTNEYPPGAMPPFKATDEEDKTLLAFVNTVKGTYRFRIAAQFSVDKKDGFDPFASDELIVVVGGVTPTPTPPPPDPAPPVIPPVVVVPPSAELQALVAPIKAVMFNADKTKAKIFASIWNDFLLVMKAGNLPTTNGEFESSLTTFANVSATQAGLVGAFPGFSAALNAAVDKQFGTSDAPIDSAKATEFVAALVWACTP